MGTTASQSKLDGLLRMLQNDPLIKRADLNYQ